MNGYQALPPTENPTTTLLTLPNMGSVQVACIGSGGPGSLLVEFISQSGAGSIWFSHVVGGSSFVVGYGDLSTNPNFDFDQGAAFDDLITAHVADGTHTATIEIGGHPGGPCVFSGQAIVQ